MKNKKFLFVALAMALALSSCERTTTESKEGTIAESITQDRMSEDASENERENTDSSSTEDHFAQESETQTDPSIVYSSEETGEVESEDVEPEHTPEVIVNDPSKFPPAITLSGKEEDHYVTTDYCYIEGDKFYLLLDKDLELPGDFADNISMIIDTLEEKVGLTYMPTGKGKVSYDPIKMSYLVGCYDPWEKFYFGQKMPIYVIVDHDGKAWVSHSMGSYTYINLLELYSDEICKELAISKEYYEGYVQYDVIAHELTHTLTQRYASLTDIMTGGSADYFAEETIRSLVPFSESFAKTVDHFDFSYHVDYPITEQNAEKLFYNEFDDLYDQTYAYGHLLCAFLAETYGDSFMHDYVIAVQNLGYTYGEEAYGEWPRDPNKRRADEFKKLFGDNVFVDYAAYYNAHKK